SSYPGLQWGASHSQPQAPYPPPAMQYQYPGSHYPAPQPAAGYPPTLVQPSMAAGGATYSAPQNPDAPEFINIRQNELVHQRLLLVYGRAGPRSFRGEASITVVHPYFPAQAYPVVDSHFKALVELEAGVNELRFIYNCAGYPQLETRLTLQ